MNCPICNIENIDKKHPYLSHKIKYADFIEKYYPKIDLYTKKLINYKNDLIKKVREMRRWSGKTAVGQYDVEVESYDDKKYNQALNDIEEILEEKE